MTDGELRGRGTILYPLVYAATLTLVAVSSFALATLGHDHVIDTGIQVSMRDDQAVVRGFVESNLTAADVQGGIATPDRRVALEASLADLVRRHGYVGVEVISARGAAVLAASGSAAAAPIPGQTTRAIFDGRPSAWIASDAASGTSTLIEAIPVLQGGDVVLAFQIRRDAAPIIAGAGDAWRDLVVVTVSAAVVLGVLLSAIFRAANIRLRKQDAELLETRRRDPLTGLLNHGAAVTALTGLVEKARADASSIGVALVDIDNFRLLNDVHGSTAGDQALLVVAADRGSITLRAWNGK